MRLQHLNRIIENTKKLPVTTYLKTKHKIENSSEQKLNDLQSWSGREDLNLRHSAPKADALPGCATPRSRLFIH